MIHFGSGLCPRCAAAPKPKKRRRRPLTPYPDDGPTGPTPHPPRSPGKLHVLAARAAKRLPLFDPRDAPGED
jgi:hypothetical protein